MNFFERQRQVRRLSFRLVLLFALAIIVIVLAVDVIVAAESAKFSQVFKKIGLVPDGGSIFFLVQHLGIARAKELVYTARMLPASEAHAVGELDRDGPLTQSALGERLRLEKSTVSRLVSQLTSRGWVRRANRGGDGRLVWLELTPDGRRAAGELAVARAARFADLLRNIPAEQRPAVIAALTTLVDAAGGRSAAVETSGTARA